MLKNMNWIKINGEFKKAKEELKITDDTSISLKITPRNGESVIRNIRFSSFLEAMWHLYDSHIEISKVDAAQSNNGLLFFEYDAPSVVNENKPINGNPNKVLNFKNFEPNVKILHINLLLHQILEEQSCIKSSLTPPSGNLL